MRAPKSKSAGPGGSAVVKQEPIHQIQSGGYPRKRSTAGKSKETQAGVCYRCGGPGHKPSDCRFKELICNNCKKKGHIARACRSQATKQEGSQKGVKRVSRDPDRTSGESEGDEERLCAVRSPGKQLPPLKVRVLLDN